MDIIKRLGPGLLFAGAAIGVSHLVQSTRAGAEFGFGLIWALLLINMVKYPFFQMAPRYTIPTGKTLLEGAMGMHKGILIVYFVLSMLTMFTIQTAVTIVTAGLAAQLFGFSVSAAIISVVILIICALVLNFGRFALLNNLMKVIVVVLAITTIIAVLVAFNARGGQQVLMTQIIPSDVKGIAFLIAFMGWMPAPMDIAIWQSLWVKEGLKSKLVSLKEALFDFNVGYMGTVIIGLCFVSMGALVMFGSGAEFSNRAIDFAGQLIGMYTSSLGKWASVLIGIAALTTMFSTTLTTLDASPRAMSKTAQLLGLPNYIVSYKTWLLILVAGTCLILLVFVSEMRLLINIATTLSFVTAPFYALFYLMLFRNQNPDGVSLPIWLRVYAMISLVLLLLFSLWYIFS